jgi:hypothetical protein
VNASNSLAFSDKASLLEGENKVEFTNLSGSVSIAAGPPAREDAAQSVASAVNAQELLAKYDTRLEGGLNQYGKDVLAGKVEEKAQEGEATHV